MNHDEAARAVKAFQKSPAWVKLTEFVEAERKHRSDILKFKAGGKTLADYAEASGAVQTLEKFAGFFQRIINEGTTED